ncbi:MAG: glycogen/starch/alpha-glucan phosphorylase [Planctomycetota bacterium]
MVSDSHENHCRTGLDPDGIREGFEAHLKYTLGKDKYTATLHNRYIALAYTIRDRLIARWIETQQKHHKRNVKRVYYLSLEYLMGRVITNNVINLGMEKAVWQAMKDLGLDWYELAEAEVDAGLGNGGLGRLAACFLDSLATLEIPAIGYGLRYEYGIFRQRFHEGRQQEEPDDWLRQGNPWEIQRPEYRFPVHLHGKVIMEGGDRSVGARCVYTRPLIGIPYDIPIVGYGGKTVNTLRLWSARAAEEFDFEDFSQGDYIAAVENKVSAENITKVLYPEDTMYEGKELRLKQQYFFVTCSLQDIVRRFKADNDDLLKLPDRVAIQLNDTHPALAIPGMMRILVDQEGLDWDTAWNITVRCFGYTNHTLLPEALEKWSVEMFDHLLPRNLQIIYEINDRFLKEVSSRYPGDSDRLRRMSLIQEGSSRQVRMAHLSIVGSHSTNGVANLHTELLKKNVVPDFNDMFPERFNAKTNGITQRRWLLRSNPILARLITEMIGDRWIIDLSELRNLIPLAEDPVFRDRFQTVKRACKRALALYMQETYGFRVDAESMFDVQVKRIHEYKRQLLNALHIASSYRRLRENPGMDVVPRTFLFGGKAAPGYRAAKDIIKLINNLARVINDDKTIGNKIRVYFLPDYRVSLAERIIPASDLSEQISLAGTEASGTGNMKFMLNGALTVGTLDGANIEMMEEVGRENIFIFGMTSEEAAKRAGTYDPRRVYETNEELRKTVDFLFSSHFELGEKGVLDPVRRLLFDAGDRYMNFADFTRYVEAQKQVEELYRDQDQWARKAILNIACSGKFSSDRTIKEYAEEIWHVSPSPIEVDEQKSER